MKILVSILLLLTILVSTIGVSVNKHICEKEGIITSYFLDIKECVCDVEIETEPVHKCCHKPQTSNLKPQKGCCQEESDFFQLEFDYTTQIENVSVNPDLLFSAVLVYNVLNPLLEVENNTKLDKFNHYSPPIPDRDIPVLIQSFLI